MDLKIKLESSLWRSTQTRLLKSLIFYLKPISIKILQGGDMIEIEGAKVVGFEIIAKAIYHGLALKPKLFPNSFSIQEIKFQKGEKEKMANLILLDKIKGE